MNDLVYPDLAVQDHEYHQTMENRHFDFPYSEALKLDLEIISLGPFGLNQIICYRLGAEFRYLETVPINKDSASSEDSL
ncbi:hypothetical protein Bca4012_009974 [Brassica carinata]